MSTAVKPKRADRLPADALVEDLPDEVVEVLEPSTRRFWSRWRVPPALRPGAPAWIWLGLTVSLVGFILIAVAWGQVAGEALVYRQVPYVISAALVGLGLVIVGLTGVNIATRQRDGLDRDRQIAELVTIIAELRDTLSEQEGK